MTAPNIHAQSEPPPPGSRGAAGDGHRGPQLSVATVVYNREKDVLDALRVWKQEAATLGFPIEILLIDDGSTDGTSENLEKLPREMPYLRVVSLPKPVGTGGAYARAISRAEGANVLVCELGFRLESAKNLLDVRQKGRLDVVCGYREPMVDDGMAALVNPALVSKFELPVRDPACPVKLLTNEVARSLLLEPVGPEVHGEIAVKAVRNGFRVGEFPVATGSPPEPSFSFGERRKFHAFVRYLRKKDALFRKGVVRAV